MEAVEGFFIFFISVIVRGGQSPWILTYHIRFRHQVHLRYKHLTIRLCKENNYSPAFAQVKQTLFRREQKNEILGRTLCWLMIPTIATSQSVLFSHPARGVSRHKARIDPTSEREVAPGFEFKNRTEQ